MEGREREVRKKSDRSSTNLEKDGLTDIGEEGIIGIREMGSCCSHLKTKRAMYQKKT